MFGFDFGFGFGFGFARSDNRYVRIKDVNFLC